MSKLDTKFKSFKLSEGKTSIFHLGLILAVALFFIGLVWLGGRAVNIQIQQLWQDASFIKKEDLVSLSSLLEKENKKLEMPEGFPKDIPIVDPDNVSQAYIRDQQTKDITMVIESKKSVKENFDYYLDYGKKNGWQIEEKRSTTGKLLLKNDKLILSFGFKDKEKGGSEIIISSTTINLLQFIDPPPPIQQEEKIPAKAGQTPEGFPEDFPLNGKTEITEAYTLKVENQAGAAYVIKFKSDQTKETNINFYQNWFKENDWLLTAPKLEDKLTLVSASLPFRKSVELRIVQIPDAKSEVEVRWREFSK